MRVLLASNHRYPADSGEGTGIRVRSNPSGAPQRVHDLLAKGLAELGHEVFYLVEGADAAAPDGVTLVSEPVHDVDVCHNLELVDKPWLKTQHGFLNLAAPAPQSWVFVSRTLARAEGSERCVLNGLDPADYRFAETKDDYLLFMAAMQGPFHLAVPSRKRLGQLKYFHKGLDIALAVARQADAKLVVAGTTREAKTLAVIKTMCRESGATFVGDVRGSDKAVLLAGAKAVLFPTRIPEGCPLILIEALLSGTPIIASDIGVCREMVTAEVGFVCRRQEDYLHALADLDRISPRACREEAMTRYHYRRMARDYVRQYELEIRGHRQRSDNNEHAS